LRKISFKFVRTTEMSTVVEGIVLLMLYSEVFQLFLFI